MIRGTRRWLGRLPINPHLAMKIAVFGAKPYARASFLAANAARGHEIAFFEPHLNPETAALAEGFGGACAFVNDVLDRRVIERLARGGTRLVALRCAGFNHVDLAAAGE